MIEGSAGILRAVALCLCLLFSQPAESTLPPERPPAVENECTKAYPLVGGHAPSMDVVDPATAIAQCNGVVLPTSLVAYYVELDSWKDLAVVELEALENKQPTFWEKWGERLGWAAVGAGVVATGALFQTGS